MIHSLHPKSPLFTTLPNINPSLLSTSLTPTPQIHQFLELRRFPRDGWIQPRILIGFDVDNGSHLRVGLAAGAQWTLRSVCHHGVLSSLASWPFDRTIVVDAMPFCIMANTSHRHTSRTKWETFLTDLLRCASRKRGLSAMTRVISAEARYS